MPAWTQFIGRLKTEGAPEESAKWTAADWYFWGTAKDPDQSALVPNLNAHGEDPASAVKDILTPTEQLKHLITTHITPLEDKARKYALKDAIALVLYEVHDWRALGTLPEAQLAAELPMIRWLCTRLASQGLPDRAQYPDLAQWIRDEQQSRAAMQTPPQQETKED